jgi:hypothetical protein
VAAGPGLFPALAGALADLDAERDG